jgi:cystathionine gamma-synthase
MSDPQLSPETIAISAGRPPVTKDGSLNPDISLSSTYHAGGELGYGRSGNETWSALESAISELEGGQTLAFASGNAAISAVFALLPIVRQLLHPIRDTAEQWRCLLHFKRVVA